MSYYNYKCGMMYLMRHQFIWRYDKLLISSSAAESTIRSANKNQTLRSNLPGSRLKIYSRFWQFQCQEQNPQLRSLHQLLAPAFLALTSKVQDLAWFIELLPLLHSN